MRMTEIVSFLDLSIFPSIAMVFFLAAFLAILWNVLRTPRSQSDLEASIPLNDDVVVEPRGSIQAVNQAVNNETTQADKGVTRA